MTTFRFENTAAPQPVVPGRSTWVRPGGGRIAELDGVRGLAVLGVITWHCIGHPLPPVGFPSHGDEGVIAILKWITSMLRSGVDLFFVLSGFLIGRILMEQRGSPNFLKTFYIRRSLRILPPYLLLLSSFLIGIVVGGHGSLFESPVPLLSYFAFVQNYFMVHLNTSGALLIAVTWSLAVEEQFYAVFPLLVRTVSRELLLLALLVGVVVAPILRIWTYFHFGGYNYPSDAWTLCRMDALFMGALLAWIERSDGARLFLMRHRRMVEICFVGLLVGIGLFCRIAATRDYDRCWALWGQSLFATFYTVGLLLVGMNSGGRQIRVLRSAFLTGVGKISYSLYLWHMFFYLGLFAIFGRNVGLDGIQDALIVGASMLLTFAFCAASSKWIEGPLIQKGHQFKY